MVKTATLGYSGQHHKRKQFVSEELKSLKTTRTRRKTLTVVSETNHWRLKGKKPIQVGNFRDGFYREPSEVQSPGI